jgi:magnesium chelatase accessory protein
MRWPRDAQNWPMTEHSRLILNRPHRWHVQEAGTGPTILLLHGAGGATQSWRGLFPLLQADFHVIAIDLPGQGFSQSGARQRLGLRPMAEDIAGLIRTQGWTIDAIVGHSAGVALALQIMDDGTVGDIPVVGLNGALSPFKGVAGWIFPVMAKLLAATPFTADFVAATASSPRSVAKLITGTGSQLDAEGIALYQRLVQDRSHVDGTLAMMSQWDLDPLLARLPRIGSRILLMTGSRDGTVPPDTSRRAADQLPNAVHETIDGLGHLMHEEDPEPVATRIRTFLAQH